MSVWRLNTRQDSEALHYAFNCDFFAHFFLNTTCATCARARALLPTSVTVSPIQKPMVPPAGSCSQDHEEAVLLEEALGQEVMCKVHT